MKILLPKNLYEVHPSDGPLFYFAGPVRGGDDWQESACTKLCRLIPDCHIALPCRYGPEHPLRKYEIQKIDGTFSRQFLWERHYMDLAARHGCLMFWLPCESLANPRDREEGPYAQDTRGELGEFRGRMIHEPSLRVVLGAEEKFPGLDQIERNFDKALGYAFPSFRSLDETIAEAVRRVRQGW